MQVIATLGRILKHLKGMRNSGCTTDTERNVVLGLVV